ncbi:MAG: thiamine biosynthesis protein ThiS [Thermoprotei archaeon]|nr:MAG: thiamine biosynthesis protein ThiS [Thermoprotei archaeon]RLF17984.1 MAG: thiamine biosynthesis protein ThiS [Thermoprotei archaeon]
MRIRNGSIKERRVRVRGKSRIRDILLRAGINPEEVVIIKDEELITEDDFISEGEIIEVLPVSLGG